MLAFFSAASCKLPTYILPAIPLLCLTMGVMLDQTVFRIGAVDRITSYLKPFPQRATMILLASCTVIIGVNVFLNNGVSLVDVFAAIACMTICLVVAIYWNRDIAFGRFAWGATTAVAVGVLIFASTVLLPNISTQRSVYLETRRVAGTNSKTLIIFFGENSHGASFHLPTEQTMVFPIEWEEEFIGLAAEQDDFILVTDDARIDQTRQKLAATHRLTASPRHRHVYQATRLHRVVESVASAKKVTR